MAAPTPGKAVTRKNIQLLAAVVVALVLAVLTLNKNDRDDSASPGLPLLQEFAGQANEVQRINVVAADNEATTIKRESDHWVVASRDDYPADISKLRQIIVALADAKILEEKTSNPDLYDKLEIDDPQEGGSGTRITIDGDGFSHTVIVGKQVQGEHRYVRVMGAEPGYLIDQNPNVPKNSNGWLRPDIVDITAKRVRKVAIKHENGETIIIEKSSEDLTDFNVLDIPQDRELKYATVGNGVAGALGNLVLDDVRVATAAAPESSAVIQTWNGLQITVLINTDDESSWLSFSAAASVDQAAAPADSSTTSQEDAATVEEEVTTLNKRLGGWQFKIPDYKKDLLTKHWEDILKPVESNTG